MKYNEDTEQWELNGERVKTLRFSFMWSDKLGDAIKERSLDPFPIECHRKTEMFEAINRAVNQGIDSHLEALFFEQGAGEYGRVRLVFTPESVPVLVRRLMEDDDDEAQRLAGDICGTLNIELI